MPNKKNKLIEYVHDKKLIEYYYLNHNIDELIDKLHSLKFTLSPDKSLVPFNAQLRDYIGAIDNENDKWIAKKVNEDEIFDHILYELAYYIDFMLETLAVPSILTKIDNDYYRASKIVMNSTQIAGYNYIESPFIEVLTNDLINRWLFFDEDRNPNNYMVIHNTKNEPLIVAIDYNKSDLKSSIMKITGNNEKFGWFRQEKTRFLTLLKPTNFENLTIDNFEYRLKLLINLNEKKLKDICIRLFKDYFEDYNEKTDLIVSNIISRKEYINKYFKIWFKEKSNNQKNKKKSDYSELGESFLKMYKDK